jgi:PadR family transcriptional regulator, regulatory protein PadR
MDHHDLLSGLVRLHILHHAAEQEVFGQWMIEELGRHGYRLSPGTIYPLLHTMEQCGYLTSREDSNGVGNRRRRLYSATTLGREALAFARERVRELGREINETR